MNLTKYLPASQPAHTYDEAVQRIHSIRSAEPPDLNPVGRLQFLTHERQTDRAIVLFHGYTNCPQQFKLLGDQFHARGYNVSIPRAPGHGLADRLADAHAHITAEQMWCALSASRRRRASKRCPSAGPKHAYPRYGTHGLMQLLRLGAALRSQARRSIPAARSVVIVKNDNDESIDNTTLDDQVRLWRSSGAQNVETYTFGVEQHLVHDLIDPDQPAQRVDYVYPILIDLLET